MLRISGAVQVLEELLADEDAGKNGKAPLRRSRRLAGRNPKTAHGHRDEP
jgi:hypothetical protein